MVFPILGGNSAVGGYAIDNSLRFNDDDSARLSATQLSGSTTTWTFSCWLKRSEIGQQNSIFTVGSSSTNDFLMYFSGTADTIDIIVRNSSTINGRLNTNAVFRDASAWYHIVFTYDSTNATSSERMRLYINGERVTSFSTETYPSLNQISVVNNSSYTMHISSIRGGADYFDGYMAEINHIDGQALSPTDFGEFDEDSGIWKPIEYSGSYGTNGFYLDFENSGSLGADQSGNGNNFTPTNLASTDQMLDTPTNNFCTPNTLDKGTTYPLTLAEGNLKITGASEANSIRSTMMMTSGKWYWECRLVTAGIYNAIGIASSTSSTLNTLLGSDSESIGYFSHTGLTQKGGTATTSGATWSTTGDIMGIAFDADNGDLTFYKNNSSQPNSYSGLTEGYWMPAFTSRTGAIIVNFGQDGSFAGTATAQGNTDANGYGDFYYAPPSGYLALCTQNLATALSPTIDDGSAHFQTLTYAGDSSARTLTNDGNSDLQPDLIWIKSRTGAQWHHLFDSSRGGDYRLHSNSTNAESTLTNSRITSFNTDGFSTTDGENVNSTGNNYVAWQWKANAGSTSSNTDGTITSTVQANTTAGFSIVTFTGNGSGGSTVGHGLGQTPSVLIQKKRSSTGNWPVYHQAYGINNYTFLNTTDANTYDGSGQTWVGISSSTFSLGTATSWNANGATYVTYCFVDVEGYSKFGKYIGNGSTDGTFVYTGFRPAFVIFKRTDIGGNWVMIDTARDTFNDCDASLYADLSNAEENPAGDVNGVDYLSNGFKFRDGKAFWNASGGTYIYMCFAENPFVSSTSIPVTAR